MKHIDKEKVVVIGAGPMGLSVAYHLCKKGVTPLVYEAGPEVGGMTVTFDFGGLPMERFYHFHCTSDVDAIRMLKELGLEDKLCWVKTKMGYFYQGKIYDWGDPFSLFRFPHLGFVSKLRYALHAFTSTKRKDWHGLDQKGAVDWIKFWIGEKAFDVLWSKLFSCKFYHLSDQISAAWIWDRIHRIGNSRYNLFEEKLGYIEGGSQTLIHGLRDKIVQNGGEIHLSCPIEKVVIENQKVKGIQTKHGFVACSKVISTAPLPYVSSMVPDFPQTIKEQYSRVKNIAVVCVIVKLKKKVTDKFWLNVNDDTMDIPGIVEYTNLRPLGDHIVYVPFYMPGELQKYQDSDEVYEQKVRSYLRTINTSLVDEDFLDICVSRYRYAQPVCTPGFVSMLPPITGVFDGLWVADTSYYYPHDRGISESFGFGKTLVEKALS
ncbi:MAG: NAD(P)/FAD-dependent oxidoreductase [Bdellovibrionales bacterium]|nr:NAD(P)/FAD-dependent oxidoreductase [Bdellovibrionales bacterium]